MHSNRVSFPWVSVFLATAGVVLLGTGLAKVASGFTGGEVLRTYDPILGLTLGTLFGWVGAIAVVVAVVCLTSRRLGLPVVLLLWLGTSFVAYRLGLWWVGGPKYCSCLGTMTAVLHLSPATVDLALKLALAYLLVGSVVSMRALVRQAGIEGLLRM